MELENLLLKLEPIPGAMPASRAVIQAGELRNVCEKARAQKARLGFAQLAIPREAQWTCSAAPPLGLVFNRDLQPIQWAAGNFQDQLRSLIHHIKLL